MTTKTKLMGAIVAAAAVLGLGGAGVFFADDIDQTVASVQEAAQADQETGEASEASQMANWYAAIRFRSPRVVYSPRVAYRPHVHTVRYSKVHVRRAWVPGRFDLHRRVYVRGYYRVL